MALAALLIISTPSEASERHICSHEVLGTRCSLPYGLSTVLLHAHFWHSALARGGHNDYDSPAVPNPRVLRALSDRDVGALRLLRDAGADRRVHGGVPRLQRRTCQPHLGC